MIFKCMGFVTEIRLCVFLHLQALGSRENQDSCFDIVISLWAEQLRNCGLISSRGSGFFSCPKISAPGFVITQRLGHQGL
jgi:hypothetical protein